MTDDDLGASEAPDMEVVQSEADNEQAEASEATESTEGQTEQAPAEVESEDDTKEKTSRHQRRRAELAKIREERERLQGQLAEVEKARKRALSFAESTRPPTESEFANYDEFLLAKGAFIAGREQDRRAVRQIDEQATEAKTKLQALEAQQLHELDANWQDQTAEARKRYADFDRVVTNPNLTITDHMAMIIKATDASADVAYQLGMNPGLAERIARMDPLYQAIELGKLSAAVSSATPRTQSRAPEPIRPVKPSAAGTVDPDKMSHKEWTAWRNSGGVPGQ